MSATPEFRGSLLDTFQACPYAAACSIVEKCYRDATDDAVPTELMAGYFCPEGLAWAEDNCGTTRFPVQNRVTQIGVQAHRFAHAYGLHLKRNGLQTDWGTAEELARGLAVVDGKFVADLRDMMVAWAQEWEHSPEEGEGQDVDLASGSFERGWSVEIAGHGFAYVWHPDYARLSNNGTHLVIHDLKSGLRKETYKPDRPDTQLARYALAFKLLFPTIQTADLRLVFINPDHPRAGDPLVWDVDFEERAPSLDLITAPVTAIRLSPEFPPNPGCWLCPYCEWVGHCDMGDSVRLALAEAPEDAAGAWAAREATYALSDALNAKRGALKRILDNAVAAHGPIQVGHDADGTPLLYGPRAQTVVEVPSMEAFVSEITRRDQVYLASHLRVEDGVGLAESVSMDDPFAEREAEEPMASVDVRLRITTGIHRLPAEEPDALSPADVRDRLGDMARQQARARKLEVVDEAPATLTPDYDEALVAAF